MTTITREFTKEQLIEQAKNNLIGLKNYVTVYPERAESEAMNIRLAEITLASLTAEPVAWDYEWAFCVTCEGPQNFKRIIEREAPPEWGVDEGRARNIIPLYAAPPAPVVPDEMTPQQASRSYGGEVRGYRDGWNACRAAMFNHSGDVIDMEAIKQQSSTHTSNGAMSGDAVKQPSNNASSLVFVDEIAEQNGVDPAITDAYMQGYHDSEGRKPAPVDNDDLREAVGDLLAALGEYPEQLVPINRKSFLVRTIRAAMLQGDKNNG